VVTTIERKLRKKPDNSNSEWQDGLEQDDVLGAVPLREGRE